jgi:hypothetical protein
LESDKKRLFYAQNPDSVELDRSGYKDGVANVAEYVEIYKLGEIVFS